jgi:hypothetical protein
MIGDRAPSTAAHLCVSFRPDTVNWKHIHSIVSLSKWIRTRSIVVEQVSVAASQTIPVYVGNPPSSRRLWDHPKLVDDGRLLSPSLRRLSDYRTVVLLSTGFDDFLRRLKVVIKTT